MKIKENRLFSVTLTYNIEAGDAMQAVDEVLAKHPLKPISLSCEPMIVDDDDD